jgi:hypothetical protein
MGGYALTLIDALDSFVILGDKQGFDRAVRLVVQDVTFDLDVKVQVFEVTIRVLGGLVRRNACERVKSNATQCSYRPTSTLRRQSTASRYHGIPTNSCIWRTISANASCRLSDTV